MFAEPVDDKPVIQKVAAPASAGPSPERPFRGEADTMRRIFQEEAANASTIVCVCSTLSYTET
jgi:hypothetical protein